MVIVKMRKNIGILSGAKITGTSSDVFTTAEVTTLRWDRNVYITVVVVIIRSTEIVAPLRRTLTSSF